MKNVLGIDEKLKNVVDYGGLTIAYEKFIIELNSDLFHMFLLIYSLQMIIIVLGASSAALVALQNDANKKVTKPLAVVVTLLLTITASIQNSFHLKENSDSLVKLSGKILEEAAEIGVEMQLPLAADEKRDAISKRIKTYNKFYIERLNIRGNVEGRNSI